MGWEFLIDEAGLVAALPGEYGIYRAAVIGALGVFLDGLPAARQAAILQGQARLPASASGPERLALLARSCPTLHKLGQTLARDRRLGVELRGQLQQLESLPPTIAFEVIEQSLVRELGSLDRLGVTLAPPALAEASVAVAIPFQAERAGRGDLPSHGVFKILKPGIEARLEEELELLEGVGAYLDRSCDELGIPPLSYREAFEQVRDKLRHEIRLDREQDHLVRARRLYEGEPRVQIPGLFEFCTPRVTAMERVTGVKVTEHGLGSLSARRDLAELVIGALIARPVFARAGDALFHADPHAGNLFLTRQGRLAILDWSLVVTLDEGARTALMQILLGALTLQPERIVAPLMRLAEPRDLDPSALRSVVRAALRRIRQGEPPGFSWLVKMLDEAALVARLRFAADLTLFRKALHSIAGVAADIAAGGHGIDRVLVGDFLGHLIGEWPRRWIALPGSRDFATRLSNADLTDLMLELPATATRFWLDYCFDLLDREGFRAHASERAVQQDRAQASTDGAA